MSFLLKHFININNKFVMQHYFLFQVGGRIPSTYKGSFMTVKILLWKNSDDPPQIRGEDIEIVIDDATKFWWLSFLTTKPLGPGASLLVPDPVSFTTGLTGEYVEVSANVPFDGSVAAIPTTSDYFWPAVNEMMRTKLPIRAVKNCHIIHRVRQNTLAPDTIDLLKRAVKNKYSIDFITKSGTSPITVDTIV